MKLLKSMSLVALMLVSVVTLSAQQPKQQNNARPGGQRPQGAQTEQKKEKETKTPEQVAEAKTKMLTEKLSLNSTQEKKVNDLMLKFAKEDAERRAEAKKCKEEGGKPAGMKPLVIEGYVISPKAQMEKAKKDRLVKVMKLLTDEQKVDYAIMISKMQERPHGPRQGMGQGQQGRGQGQKPQMKQGQKPSRGQQQGGEQGQRPQRPQRPTKPAGETQEVAS